MYTPSSRDVVPLGFVKSKAFWMSLKADVKF